MRSLVLLLAAAAAASGQTAATLTGFPFQNEALHYKIRWTDGLLLGDAVFSARKTPNGWTLESSIEAGIPGFAIKDLYRSSATADLCSDEFERKYNHRGKQSAETTTFDRPARRAVRRTTVPPSDGKSEFTIPACPHDAVTFVYFMRREMGQGRVAPAETVYFGSQYSVALRYTGEVKAPQGVADRVVGTVKGPGSSFTVEIDFARDPARTPLVIRVPMAVGSLSAELVR
jgi:hypothetical protein